MSEAQDRLKRQQEAAKLVYNKMLALMTDYDPCLNLKVADVLFIARMAQTFAFDRFREMDDTQ